VLIVAVVFGYDPAAAGSFGVVQQVVVVIAAVAGRDRKFWRGLGVDRIGSILLWKFRDE
jgi:hypothetical protein